MPTNTSDGALLIAAGAVITAMLTTFANLLGTFLNYSGAKTQRRTEFQETHRRERRENLIGQRDSLIRLRGIAATETEDLNRREIAYSEALGVLLSIADADTQAAIQKFMTPRTTLADDRPGGPRLRAIDDALIKLSAMIEANSK